MDVEGTLRLVDTDGHELPHDDLSEEDLFQTYTTNEVDIIEIEDAESDYNLLQYDNQNPLLPLAVPNNDWELDEDEIDDSPPLVLNASSDSEYSSDASSDSEYSSDEDDEEDDVNNNNTEPTEEPTEEPAVAPA